MKNRWQRLKFFLVVWLTMFSLIFVQGQNFGKMGIKNQFLPDFHPLVFRLKTGFREYTDRNLRSLTEPGSRALPLITDARWIRAYSPMPYKNPDYYSQLGIMCKAEWQIEKATRIPFRFRLGSLADCDALEGKY